MKLFGTTVFIVDLEKTDNGRSCSKHLVCGGSVVRGMKVVFKHCVVNHDGGPDEPSIAVHAINGGLEGCRIGFLNQDMAYWDCHTKRYEGVNAVVVNVFSRDQFETPSKTHRRMVRENYGCAKVMIISEDSKTINKRRTPSSVVDETCLPHIEKKIKEEKKSDSDNKSDSDDNKSAAV